MNQAQVKVTMDQAKLISKKFEKKVSLGFSKKQEEERPQHCRQRTGMVSLKTKACQDCSYCNRIMPNGFNILRQP